MGGRAARRVLVVDDEPVFRMLITTILQQAGYTVSSACDGHQALDVITQQQFDLVITDYSMPGLNGVQLMSQLRATYPSVPVVLISGVLSSLGDVTGQHPFCECLRKPFTETQLMEAVTRAESFHGAGPSV